jgi:acetyl esterase/lipase
MLHQEVSMPISIAAALALLLFAGDPSAAEPMVYRQTTNVVYAEMDGVGLLMDVFTPAKPGGPGKGFGIVCVCSGGWTSDRGMVDAHRKVGLLDALCGHGYTVFAVRPGNYSIFTGEQMLKHVNAGIRYVKAHARDFGIDSQRLGLVGVSAGGHLACLAATRVDPSDPIAKDPMNHLDTRVRAVGVFCPATDFLDWGGRKYGLDLMGWRLAFSDGVAGKTEQQKDDAARAISPVNYVKPGLPPFYIVHGDADSLIPFSQSLKLAEALRTAGVSVELIAKHGADHSWTTIRQDFETLAAWFDTTLAAR